MLLLLLLLMSVTAASMRAWHRSYNFGGWSFWELHSS
jgi:hypothetical protein